MFCLKCGLELGGFLVEDTTRSSKRNVDLAALRSASASTSALGVDRGLAGTRSLQSVGRGRARGAGRGRRAGRVGGRRAAGEVGEAPLEPHHLATVQT